MAKTVGDLLIKLKAEGLESITALKSAFKSLGKASLSTDQQLEKFRKEVVEVAKATKVSQQSIRGQIDAFKGLKQQATIGSTVYRRLGKDIDALTESLDKLNKKEEEAAKKPRTAKQIFGEGVAVVPEKFSRQIAAGNEILQKLKVTSGDYGTQLAAVTARTQEFTRAQQRQQVVAQNLVATNRAQTTGFLQSTKVNIENTHTTAALKQKIAELAQDLDNIDVGSKEYITTSNRLKEAQQELNQVLGISSAAFDDLSRAQERAERRAKKLADIQQYYGTSRTGEGQAAQRAGGFRDPVTGAMIARGTRAGRVPLAKGPVPDLSSLYKTIVQIETAGVDATLDRMGKSYQQVAKDIRSATLASNGSINSLQAQRTAMAQLRAGLDPTSQDFRELGREIEKVDLRLEKLNKGRRRFSAKGFAAGLGGVAAGGVFGGPEGALGAAAGGIIAGGAGVAAGAALGAQVKMLREALGATSDYAAELQKLEIALEGVTKVTDEFGNVDIVSSLGSYQAGLKAASEVTRDFNVPLAVSTKGITRLAAAVIGAGGNIGDAEVVFRNITSAIKATGGGAQDVESAITAMVQTFSKGKVSAEELSGQLGERLPGAVTKFAEANDMTLPQLQKAFKAGTVGLDELMKFIISLGPEYEETARKIADSSADAGARASVAFEQVRREVGAALQPIGAELQKAFSEFVLEILPAIKGGALAAANGMNALLDVSALLISNFKELLLIAGVAGVALALQNLTAIAFGVAVALGKATAAMKAFTAASLLNPWVLLAAGIAAATVALVKHTKKNAEFNKDVMRGKTSQDDANKRLDEMNKKIKELEARKEKEGNNRMLRALTRQLRSAKKAADELKLAMAISKPYTVAGITYDPVTGRAIDAPMSYKPTDFDGPGLDTDSTGKPKKMMSEIELAVRRQLREAIAQENQLLASNLQLGLDMLSAYEEIEDKNKRINMEEQAKADYLERNKAINEKLRKEMEEQAKVQQGLRESLEDRQFKLGMITQEEYNQLLIARERKKLEGKGASEGMIEDTLAVMRQELDPDFATRINVELQEMKKNFKELVNPANQVIGAAKAIGSNFKTAFMDVITGSKSAKQALADFFKRTAEYFLEMAADIIAKQLVMITLQTILKALGAAVSAGSSTTPPSTMPDASTQTGLGLHINGVDQGINADFAANGAYFQGGFRKFANGGSVNKPTLGLVGEGGESEYIIPESKMRESMKRYSRGARGSAVIPTERGATSAEMESGVVGAGAIDVRYTVERINNVEYVTAAQFQQGMQKAAAEGAAKGEQQTLRRLQMSGSTRRRLGM